MRILVERNGGEILRAFGMLKDRLGDLSLALYGEAQRCCAVMDVCEELGLPVACICDTQGSSGEHRDYYGVPITTPEALQKEFADSIVAVCREDGVVADLANKGLILIPPEYSKMLMVFSKRPSIRTFRENCLDGYAWAFDFFKDEISKQTVVDRLRLYFCGKPMQANTQCALYYEDGYISIGENEVFVDGGAYKGETSLGFIKRLKSQNYGHAHIYAFEPDTKMYPLAVENLSQCPNTTVIPKGLWSAEVELSFYESSATASSSFLNMPVSSAALAKAPVTSLDTVFAGVPDSDLPTFIKMDIEGAEKEALTGAADIIRRKKPKLAICAYHKPEDVFELPQTILNIRDDYSFALRQHENGVWDTIIYAV
ncbi:MAG: FkbM family methyltransferase [Holophagales bacterium]|nr:FkbM family methyltransferase [Holophagales bacterium]